MVLSGFWMPLVARRMEAISGTMSEGIAIACGSRIPKPPREAGIVAIFCERGGKGVVIPVKVCRKFALMLSIVLVKGEDHS